MFSRFTIRTDLASVYRDYIPQLQNTINKLKGDDNKKDKDERLLQIQGLIDDLTVYSSEKKWDECFKDMVVTGRELAYNVADVGCYPDCQLNAVPVLRTKCATASVASITTGCGRRKKHKKKAKDKVNNKDNKDKDDNNNDGNNDNIDNQQDNTNNNQLDTELDSDENEKDSTEVDGKEQHENIERPTEEDNTEKADGDTNNTNNNNNNTTNKTGESLLNLLNETSKITSPAEAVQLGLAIGDSLGATTEFLEAWQVPKYLYDGWPILLTGGGVLGWGKGSPTDDTDMSMCIFRSFVNNKRFDAVDVCKQFVEWIRSGPNDVGGSTRNVLSDIIRREKEKEGSGYAQYWASSQKDYSAVPWNAPNGSLMRNGTVAALLSSEGSLMKVIECSVLHGIITHFSPGSVLSCVIHSVLIYEALQKHQKNLPVGPPPTAEDILKILNGDWKRWKKTVKNTVCKNWLSVVGKENLHKQEQDLFKEISDFKEYDPFHDEFTEKMGWSVLSLKIALWALYWSFAKEDVLPKFIPAWLPVWIFRQRGFKVILWVVCVGRDADTYGAIAGALLGAYFPNQIWEAAVEGLEVGKEIRDGWLLLQQQQKSDSENCQLM